MTVQQSTTPLPPLPDIDDVPPFSQEDQTCLEAIKQVLKDHNRLQRFGVCLLHDHFPVADDEILLETCDPANRSLLSTPVKRDALGDMKIVWTSWRLDGDAVMKGCREACGSTKDGHVPKHHTTR